MTNRKERDIRDWFIFGKVMEDPDICHDFLSTLLQETIGPLKTIVREKDLRITVDGKTVRLDICATEKDLSIYDAEMQNLAFGKSVKSLQLPLRSRAYQSMIDSDVLEKGTRYQDLPDVNIIFICTFDPFGKGKYLYLFENTCTRDMAVRLEDRSRRFFFNVTSKEPDIPDGIRKLFDYIMSRKVGDDLTERIDLAVERAMRNSNERSQYMHVIFPDDVIDEFREDLREEIRDELVEEIRDGLIDEVREMLIEQPLRRGKTCEEISDFLGIPLESVKEVEKKIRISNPE